jgi:hypothetical protein
MMSLFKKKSVSISQACPFCGGEPRLSRCGDQKEFWLVQCSECCRTPVPYDEAKCTPDYAIKIWNERAAFAEHVIKIYNSVKASMTKFTVSEVSK